MSRKWRNWYQNEVDDLSLLTITLCKIMCYRKYRNDGEVIPVTHVNLILMKFPSLDKGHKAVPGGKVRII